MHLYLACMCGIGCMNIIRIYYVEISIMKCFTLVVCYIIIEMLVHCRHSEVPKIGYYRDKLNYLKMIGYFIEQPTMTSELTRQGFRSQVFCKLHDGQEIVGDSVRYYPGKKAISEEKAAEDALSKINACIPKSKPLPQPTANSDTPSTNKLVYKGKLNNLLIQGLKLGMPYYQSVKDSEGKFQCTVHHAASFGSVTGGEFLTKKEAENSAAWRAWLKLEQTDN